MPKNLTPREKLVNADQDMIQGEKTQIAETEIQKLVPNSILNEFLKKAENSHISDEKFKKNKKAFYYKNYCTLYIYSYHSN